MTTVSKNVYIYILFEIVDKYNNTYHRTIKINSVNVKSDTYIEHSVDYNDKDPKLKVGDHVRISK